ncbi:MAG: PspC domain-containing protein [Bacteroidales bacterium]|nr:PspC domain-containing protein [Bacteroidales bacterium]MBO5848043.1 PspC domain-containing protein [Bacteroidales bacterium]MBO5854838.1 PspC domain-containing protein [Bacteroidales bacterium]
MRKDKRLKRNVANKILGGVCSGLADYFDIDVVLVRAIVASSILFAGVGLGLYIILWLFLPEEL